MASPYANERDLGAVLALSPAEQQRDIERDRSPESQAELAMEIRRATDPKIKAILIAHRDGQAAPDASPSLAQVKPRQPSLADGWLAQIGEGDANKPRNNLADGWAAVLRDGVKMPVQKRTERTLVEAGTDTLKGLASGIGGLVETAGTLGGLATGNVDNSVSEFGKGVRSYWEDAQSDVLKGKKADRKAAIDAADGEVAKGWEAFKQTVSDPALALDTLASNAASLVPGAAVGRLAAGAKYASGLKAASELGPASLAAREVAAKSAAKVGTAAAVGTGALQQGTDVSGDVYESVMKYPDSVWLANQDFMRRLQHQEDRSPEAIQALKEEFATAAARATMPGATGISLVAQKIVPGATMLERALVGGVARDTIKAGTKYALPKAIAKGALGETTEEMAEEGGGAAIGNIAKRELVNQDQKWWEGVGEATGMGAAGGLMMGAAGGAMHRQRAEVQAQLDDLGQNGLKNQFDAVDTLHAPKKAAAESLRAAGDKVGAEALEKSTAKKVNAARAALEIPAIQDADETGMMATPQFQDDYAKRRIEGQSPSEAAARSLVLGTFIEQAVAGGMPEEAIQKAIKLADGKPMDELPDFLDRAGKALAAKGIGNLQAIDQQLADAAEHALTTVANGMYVRMQTEEQHQKALQKMADDMDALYWNNKRTGAAEAVSAATQPNQPEVTSTAETSTATAVDAAANEAATSQQNDLPQPTEAQKDAGNYKVGRVKLHGMDVSIENPKGSERSGTGPDGKTWTNTLAAHYGYIRGTEGNDGDHVDTFIGENPDSERVFVVDQLNQDGSFDEHKVILGTNSRDEADALYHANYEQGWTGRGAITEMALDDFKTWVRDGKKTEPLSPTAERPRIEPGGEGAPENSPPTDTPTGTEADTTQTPSPEGVSVSGDEKTAPAARPETLIELRKRQSVLKSLLECLGA